MIDSFRYFYGFTNIINLNLTTVQVTGGYTRRLSVTWEPELAQDLEAMWGIDVSASLLDIFARELRNQIDDIVIRELISKSKIESFKYFR